MSDKRYRSEALPHLVRTVHGSHFPYTSKVQIVDDPYLIPYLLKEALLYHRLSACWLIRSANSASFMLLVGVELFLTNRFWFCCW